MRGIIAWQRALMFGALLAAAPLPAAAQDANSFYKGQTLHLIVGSAVGGGYDAYARLMADHMPRHIPGNPSIVIQNMPGAGSLVATNYIANVAPKDGTAIGAINPLMATASLLNPERTKFDPRQINWIGALIRETHVGVVRAASPVKTLDDARQHETLVSGTGGSTDTYPVIMNALLGTKFKVVSGYSGTAQGLLAVERGEVDGNVGITWNSLKATQAAALRDGRIRVFAQFGLKKDPELANASSAFDEAKTPETKAGLRLLFSIQEMGRPFIAPSGVPAPLLAVLRKAFDETVKDPQFRADAEKRHLDVDPTSGAEIQSIIEDIYKTPPQVVTQMQTFLKGTAQ
ncbi:MAG TPA: tripartite tricarboxylate transporter substrate-binding protein [Xanthobacteraceae bacterium]|nr:tripartite tricarboxylate transporter substrate-binding protein [Xanthobacteraceae bacterium]